MFDQTPVDVSVKGFTWSSAGTWTLVVMLGGTIAAIGKAIGIPRLVELFLNRNKDLRAEKREEELSDDTRIKDLQERQQRSDRAITFLATAVQIAMDALAENEPAARAAAAKRTRAMVKMAVDTLGDKDPYGLPLDLFGIPGVGE